MQALRELLARYSSVWCHAWQQRHTLNGLQRTRQEAQFMPAALALQDTPVHPAPRIAMWLIVAFAVTTVVWACCGRIEIVAVAPGKVIPSDRSKVIQPLEAATVQAIFVTDGQEVKAGDPLIELDATTTGADVLQIRHELAGAQLALARSRALLQAMDSGKLPRLATTTHVDAGRLAQEQRLLAGQHDEYLAQLAQADAAIQTRRSELQSTQELVQKLKQTAPIAQERAENYKDLLARKFISRHGYLEQETQRIELTQDLAASVAKHAEVEAQLLEAQRLRIALIAETRRHHLDELNQAELQVANLSQDGIKAERRNALMRLSSPVDGVVQQLAVHTVGGVVTPAQALLVVVPKDNPVEIEALLANKDVGFVNRDMSAEVKIETFLFTKYGTIPGTVSFVSNDAIADEKRGLVYQTRVKLSRATMMIDDKLVNLSPGMAVTVEIKTGTRRVIEYFLNPFLQYRAESLRER